MKPLRHVSRLNRGDIVDHNSVGLIDQLTEWLGGWAVILISGFMGRMMYHSQEVRHNRRHPFGREFFWEFPFIIGMAIVSDGIGAYFQLDQKVTVALAGVASYYGPRTFDFLVSRIIKSPTDGK